MPQLQIVGIIAETSDIQTVQGQTYSLFQQSSSVGSETLRPITRVEVVTMVRRLSKLEHSATLAQVISRGVNSLITDLTNKLQTKAPSESSHTSYRDEGTSKATEKKEYPFAKVKGSITELISRL